MKPMDCREARKRMTAGDAAAADHGRACSACSSYRARLEAARRCLKEHHAGVTPDAAFAARVLERLAPAPMDGLGWAAARLMPAMLALALVLAWYALVRAPGPTEEGVDGTADNLLAWIIDDGEAGP